ncbi:competence type IV pilus minor pilin ComGF [Streptococcaceae bacterium ESL0687]|nr:competence type IV pilus minor pilin ComGF [Streptococcaceae bacterium ESL0687]
MRLKTRSVKAFTLVECLLALIVLSGSLLVVGGLTNLVGRELNYVAKDEQLEWQLFCNLLREELEGSKLIKVDHNYLYVKKSNDLRFGQNENSSDFRKTHVSGRGYQPMIFNLKSTSIEECDGLVTFNLTFLSGKKYTMIYRFEGREQDAG